MTYEIEESESSFLRHYGILRKSGRYPWGSGGHNDTIPRRSRSFLDYVALMKSKGLDEKTIAEGVGLTLIELRDARSIANAELKAANVAQAQALRDKNHSIEAISQRMGIPAATVRSYLKPGADDRHQKQTAIADLLRSRISETSYVDIGKGSELHLPGVSEVDLRVAVARLKSEGYEQLKTQTPTSGGNLTTVKVLAPPGTTYSDVKNNKDRIKFITDFTENRGRSFGEIDPPISIDSRRIQVKFKEDGGDQADGVIYVRPGAKDLDLGGKNYAQVRIMVDNERYLKGMAVLNKDLPDGVDLQFNTNKSKSVGKLEAMKKISDDPENPFGAIVRQLRQDPNDLSSPVRSAMNIVNEEGDWENWSKTLSSQFLSKQSTVLAERQLADAVNIKREAFDEISKLTNPVVKQKLLLDFADAAEASAVHLKAAAMDRQRTQVLLPLNTLKSTEVYAPNFNDGERVVLVRFPHGGTFEIPELTVNTKNAQGKKLIGQATDAIGINHEVAKRLSGADFDGDTVLVIPNNRGHINTTSPLKGLKDFDPQEAYPKYPGMRVMSESEKQKHMGSVSNLITDMTIRGASEDEIARAVRHSMVVIDAPKHELNYKLSAERNGIAALAKKYQAPYNESGRAGASTLVSRKKSTTLAPRMKDRGIDPKTGKKIQVEDAYYTKDGVRVVRKQKVKKLELTDDAHTLSSGTKMESVYAEHSNRLKSLADLARKEAVNAGRIEYSASAEAHYSREVARLNSALTLAKRNRPLERQARIISDAEVSAKKAANPEMTKDQEKKIRHLALDKARNRVGASRHKIVISDREWEAIQSGALSSNKLKQILDDADLDRVKELATPRSTVLMTSSKKARAKSLLDGGLTQAEVASILGVSLTTLKRGLV